MDEVKEAMRDYVFDVEREMAIKLSESYGVLSTAYADVFLAKVGQYIDIKYLAQFASRKCGSENGMWGIPTRLARSHKYLTISRAFRFQRTSTVLDLGAGCGEQDVLIRNSSGASVVTQDLVLSNLKWMLPYVESGSLLAACPGDMLHFLETAPAFDFILANGVINSVRTERRCTVVQRILGLLLPGGKAWFGYNDFRQTWWLSCDIPGGALELVDELVFFNGTVEYAFQLDVHTAFLSKL